MACLRYRCIALPTEVWFKYMVFQIFTSGNSRNGETVETENQRYGTNTRALLTACNKNSRNGRNKGTVGTVGTVEQKNSINDKYSRQEQWESRNNKSRGIEEQDSSTLGTVGKVRRGTLGTEKQQEQQEHPERQEQRNIRNATSRPLLSHWLNQQAGEVYKYYIGKDFKKVYKNSRN